jgi:hypothetical protein
MWKQLCDTYEGKHALVLQEENAPVHTARASREQLGDISTLTKAYEEVAGVLAGPLSNRKLLGVVGSNSKKKVANKGDGVAGRSEPLSRDEGV